MIYRDLNIYTLFYNEYIDEVQHGAEFMLSRITLYLRWEMNLQWSIARDSDIILLLFYIAIAIRDLKIYLILSDHVMHRLSLLICVNNPRGSVAKSVRVSRSLLVWVFTVGKNFSFCNSRFLRVPHRLTKRLRMKSSVSYN